MRIKDIILLRENGVLEATSHSLNSKDAYNFFKLKKEIDRIFKDLGDKELALFKDAGIENPSEFIKEFNELRTKEDKTEKDNKILSEYNKKWIRANELLISMREDDVKLNISTISFESWRNLQKENKELKVGDKTVDVFSGYVELLLENIFWQAPEE